MSNRFSVKFNRKEVDNPFLRTSLLILALVIVAIAVIIVAAVPIILIFIIGSLSAGIFVFFALIIVPHFILLTVGRRGFFKKTHDSNTNVTVFKLNISSEAFKKAERTNK